MTTEERVAKSSTYTEERVDSLPFNTPEKSERYRTERFPGAIGLNWFDCDPTLQRSMRYYLTEEQYAWAEPRLRAYGEPALEAALGDDGIEHAGQRLDKFCTLAVVADGKGKLAVFLHECPLLILADGEAEEFARIAERILGDLRKGHIAPHQAALPRVFELLCAPQLRNAHALAGPERFAALRDRVHVEQRAVGVEYESARSHRMGRW